MIGLRETLRFLDRHLPTPPARVLEVGAGDGAVAVALADRGYAATALDLPGGEPRTHAGVEWIEADFLHYEPGRPFDAVLFTRSLHHMQPIERALDRAREALAPEGLLIAEEFAFDRVNVHTARWLYDLESVLVAAGIVAPAPPEHEAERRPLARWRLEHQHDPPLASGHDMLAAVRERFELKAVEEAPYLYRYLGERMSAEPTADRVLETVFELEARLIRERDIAAAGLRFMGKPSA
jgi:ubiquinone/menaquinone biosynthesis C-methylase UbiE